jgi:hypothetical protein
MYFIDIINKNNNRKKYLVNLIVLIRITSIIKYNIILVIIK